MHKGCDEWFRNWFDSPYYHILYQHRDEEEARFFIDHLLNYLLLPEEADILDIPCGKGRHAIYLGSKNYRVTGMDLSPANIRQADSARSANVQFFVHDMRQHLGSNLYHCIFNLFTSLGYFKWEHENLTVIQNMAAAVKSGGRLVVDFFNTGKLSGAIYPENVVDRENITFHIRRRREGKRIIKSITVRDADQTFNFEENVMLIEKELFETWFRKAGLQLIQTFGSYDLQDYHPEASDRLIFILKKP